MVRWRCVVLLLLFGQYQPLAQANSQNWNDSEGVIREVNLARQRPGVYVGFLEELRENLRGHVCTTTAGFTLHLSEGIGALDDAIRFLRNTRPIAPLASSSGLSRAAAEHVAAQASGGFGHTDFGQTPANRIFRYGTRRGPWGEDIAYGESSPRDIVLALIIDDGLRTRGHRKNIFNPRFNYVGAALGPHARFGTVCSIDFAGGFAENASDSPSFVTRN